MGLEIERKFLVQNDSWKSLVAQSFVIQQGYLNSHQQRTVRVRVLGDQGILTIKGKNEQLTRPEFEYEIPLNEAKELLNLCEKPIIHKVRHLCHQDDITWEVDVFEDENEGLILAEVELSSEDQSIVIPDWIGTEVSTDPRFFNSALIKAPYRSWPAEKPN